MKPSGDFVPQPKSRSDAYVRTEARPDVGVRSTEILAANSALASANSAFQKNNSITFVSTNVKPIPLVEIQVGELDTAAPRESRCQVT